MKLDPPVQTLLVDLDGTLLGNRNLHLSLDFAKRTLAAMRKYGGWRKSVSTLLGINSLFKKPSTDLTNDLRAINLFSRRLGLAPEVGRRVLREELSEIFPQLQRHFFPVPGSKEFLDWAKDRYPLILATNPVWPPEIIELRVKWAGIDPAIFKSMTHIRRMHACKPTAEYYKEILEQEGLKAEDCLLIGDNVKMDLPATRVGIRVFIVGRLQRLSPLKYSHAKAPAWQGSYSMLRKMLED